MKKKNSKKIRMILIQGHITRVSPSVLCKASCAVKNVKDATGKKHVVYKIRFLIVALFCLFVFFLVFVFVCFVCFIVFLYLNFFSISLSFHPACLNSLIFAFVACWRAEHKPVNLILRC